jgi:hypothetical protein
MAEQHFGACDGYGLLQLSAGRSNNQQPKRFFPGFL